MNQQEAKKLEKKILAHLNKHLGAKTTVIAAISGGPDSVFLLHFLTQTKAKIILAHLNHNLRQKDSDKDQKFVEELAAEHKIPCRIKSVKIKDISAKSKKGLEETGRIQRYKFFNDLAKKHNADFIITAHHADDNLETIILNLTRGTTLKGLIGIEEIAKPSPKQNSKSRIFRPLLPFSKKQILNYLKLKKITYRLDKSNKDKTYSRNFIRHEIIPKLQKLNPNLSETIAKNSENLKEIHEFLEQKAQIWLHKNLQKNAKFAKSTSFPASAFKKQSKALQKAILLNLHKKLTGDTQNISAENINEILNLIHKNIGNKTKKLRKLSFSLKTNIVTVKTTSS